MVEPVIKDPVSEKRSMLRFIVILFSVRAFLGLVSSLGYTYYLFQIDPEWKEPNRALYPVYIVLSAYVFGFTLPGLGVVLRATIRGFFMNCHAIENQDRMIVTIEETGSNAKPIFEDVKAVAHKVRDATEAMNGSLNVKVLEGHMSEIKGHLATIAEAMSGKVPELEITAFDPTRKKRRSL